MRGVLVRNVGFSILALALSVFAGCNDNPLGFDVKDSKDILVDPSSMVLSAGRPGKLTSRTVNQGLEPTFDQIVAQRDPACGPATITIEEDLSLAPAFPPGVFDITGGSTLGTTCVVLTSGDLSKTVDITLVADAIEVVSAPVTVRAGEGGTIVARLTDVDGNEVLPYDPLDVGWLSNDPAILDLSAGDGTFTTATAGTSEITLTWTGQEANGTAGTGVVRTAELVINVGSNVPVAASYTVDGEATEDLGAYEVGQAVEFPILVTDAEGNQVTDTLEVLGITLDEPLDPAVTATARIARDEVVQGNEPYVEITGVSAGQPVVSGTVQTSEGDLPFTGVFSVLAPSVTGISTATGFVGTEVTISGLDLSVPGFDTEVLIDGASVSGDVADPGFVVSVSPTDVVILMPDLGDANDAFEVGISVGGVAAPETFTYTQLADAAEDEPANDNPATPTVITLPTDKVGSFEGADVDDFHLITVTGAFTVDLDWDDHSVDLDILIDDENLGFTFPCGFDGATGAAPEQHVCEVPAGNYLIWINNYSGPDHPTSYRLEIN